MVEAAVGFQCPDCVREGRRSVRPARTTFGGRAVADATVTRVLIALNVLGFLYELQVGENVAAGRFAMSPTSVAHGEYYRLVTAAFLHYGPIHLALNMYALYMLGSQVERTLGRSRFVAMYLASALGGSMLSYLLSPRNVLGAGASGAVYGLFGAYFVIARRLRADTSQIVGVIGFNLVFSFVVPSIDWRAHIGGLLVGGALTYAFAHLDGPRRDVLHAAAVAAVVVLLLVVIAVRTAALRDAPVQAGSLGAPLASAVSVATTSSGGAPSR
jgi:membrane associated rhomboid family serine protease